MKLQYSVHKLTEPKSFYYLKGCLLRPNILKVNNKSIVVLCSLYSLLPKFMFYLGVVGLRCPVETRNYLNNKKFVVTSSFIKRKSADKIYSCANAK